MGNTLWEIEADFIRLMADIKEIGIKIDREFCKPKVEKGEIILHNIKRDLGWNPGSGKDLEQFLIKDRGFPIVKVSPKTGKPSFDKFAMEEYDELLEADGSDIAKKVLRYRGWQKTVTSNYKPYLDLADKNNILHPNYKVHGTRTCRLSCEWPNLQQIPRESAKEWNGDLKQAFISRHDLIRWWYEEVAGIKLPKDFETVLIDFDYKQIELRKAAAVSKEPDLLAAFHNDVDVYQVMADRLGWDRQDCKTFILATMYGAGIRRIKALFGIENYEAKEMIEEFYGNYPRLRKAIERAEQVARNKGYVQYWTGRRRHLTEKYSRAFNAAIQGGAFEIVKRSMLRVNKLHIAPIALTVHDDVVGEFICDDNLDINIHRFKECLEAVPEAKEMGVPFKIDNKRWGESD